MKTVELTKATLPLSNYTKKIKKTPLIIMEEGRPVAALVNMRDTDAETASLSGNPKFMSLIERSRTRRKTEGGVSAKEMRRRLECG